MKSKNDIFAPFLNINEIEIQRYSPSGWYRFRTYAEAFLGPFFVVVGLPLLIAKVLLTFKGDSELEFRIARNLLLDNLLLVVVIFVVLVILSVWSSYQDLQIAYLLTNRRFFYANQRDLYIVELQHIQSVETIKLSGVEKLQFGHGVPEVEHVVKATEIADLVMMTAKDLRKKLEIPEYDLWTALPELRANPPQPKITRIPLNELNELRKRKKKIGSQVVQGVNQ